MKFMRFWLSRTNSNLMRLLMTFLIAMIAVTDANSEETQFEHLQGIWQVQGVRLDTTYGGRTAYDYDDPSLVGRLFIIKADEITSDLPEMSLCFKPGAREIFINIDTLVKSTMSIKDDEYADFKAKRSSELFELPTKNTKEVRVW